MKIPSLELARKQGLIDSIPAKDAVRPSSNRKKHFAPLADDVRRALGTATTCDPSTADFALFSVPRGMRTGELLGLQWADIDLGTGDIHVAASITNGGPGAGFIRKATKLSDWRDVPLTEGALALLRGRCDRCRSQFEQSPPPMTYVFGAAPNGVLPVRPDALRRSWKATRGPGQITLLDLRQFVATVMLDSGESYRTVGEILTVR